MKRISYIILCAILSLTANAQITETVDTVKASKLAKKALKLMNSKKGSDWEKGFEKYQEAANMGLVSAQRDLVTYYLDNQDEVSALSWSRKLAESGDVEAQYLLGYVYLGIDTITYKTTPNSILGMRYMRMAAEQGHSSAELFYGSRLLNGTETVKDTEKGLFLLMSSADKGNVIAQYQLGCMFYWGNEVTVDYKKSFSYTEKAAEQGLGDAQYNLGHMYHLAEGVDKNLDEAIYWYTKALEKGVNAAKNNLALVLEEKNGGADEAIILLRKGADSGDEVAQYNLGTRYETGKGVTQSYEMAYAWYQKSANAGYAPSQRNVGLYYHKGIGVSKDYDKAFEWILRAAEQEDTVAVNALGAFYEEGIGVKPDPDRAFYYYQKAANLGYTYSDYNLSRCYLSGQGVDKSITKAIEYATIAADNNIFMACISLGYIYSDPEQGILKDNKKAITYYRKALSLLEEKDAQRAEILFSMSLIYKELNDTKNTVDCLKESADLGNPRAQYNLALCYYNGDGVYRDINKAKELLRNAASNKEDKEAASRAQKALTQI